MTRHWLSGGVEEIFAAEQAPGDDNESGKGNTEYHAEYAAEGGTPEEYGNDDDNWMKAGLASHNARGKQVALDDLNDPEGDAAPEEDAPLSRFGDASGLEVGDKDSGGDADDGTKIRHDVEEPEEET